MEKPQEVQRMKSTFKGILTSKRKKKKKMNWKNKNIPRCEPIRTNNSFHT